MSESKAIELLRSWLDVADDDLRAVSRNGDGPEMCVVCLQPYENHTAGCLVGRTERLLDAHDAALQQEARP